MDPTNDARAAAAAAAAAIAAGTDCPRHDVAVVLGSGWAPAATEFGTPVADLPMSGLPGFTAPSARGHDGRVLSVRIGTARVLVILGRVHAYEGHDLARVVHPVRAAAAAGVHTVVLTNAAGGIRPGMRVGEPVLITTGRKLGPVETDTVVMLDGQQAFLRADPDLEIFWGAYLGSPDQLLISGRLGDVAVEIAATRDEARARHGWIMDTYLLRKAR